MSEFKIDDLDEIIKNPGSSLVQLLAVQLKNTLRLLEKSEIDAGQLIDERDAAELALADMYEKVTGEKPEWSNMFGFVDAVDVVDESIAEFERRLQEKDRLLEGVTQDAIDGGWTARGLSEHAVRVEKALANANDEAAHERNRRCKFEADCKALQQKLGLLAAENATMKIERSSMTEIGELIRTQDNRITDQPFFAVMVKREIVGSEDHDYDRICWVENQSGDYVEATETQHRRLEAIYQSRYEVRDGWDRCAMKDIDVFVTGCFTEKGCEDYISRNKHNLNRPFIYAFGSYRNYEFQEVRKFIMEMPETPATDAQINALRAEGIDMWIASRNGAWNGTTEQAKKFAAQLRNGEHVGEDGI